MGVVEMSFITDFENWLTMTETKVQAIIVQIQQEVPVVEAAIHAALQWVAGQVPGIAADLQTVTALITALGFSSNPNVATAIADANLAVQALNAFAAAEKAGSSDAQAIVNGYVALKQAQAAVASATAASVAPVAKAA
jgi:hypothetical protein